MRNCDVKDKGRYGIVWVSVSDSQGYVCCNFCETSCKVSFHRCGFKILSMY